jgi:hypothetical protein
MVALVPSGATLPVLGELLLSLGVLAEGRREAGSTCAPRGGASALSMPCSRGLFSLAGMPAARACVWAARCDGTSPATAGPGLAGPLSVLRAAALALLRSTSLALEDLAGAFRFGMKGSVGFSGWRKGKGNGKEECEIKDAARSRV